MFINIFWLIFVIIGIIGFGLGTLIMSKMDGYYDFFTPLFSAGIYVITTVILIMMILGKYVF